ncbi:MAG: hypothetical protein PHR77_14675 [Kiritimatiellae bacterium]|nr:hypothetical protein [Kiritimatiellia bacterium]MDD5521264.1 hypothetical protein [Kiritimatiellia bacterium]
MKKEKRFTEEFNEDRESIDRRFYKSSFMRIGGYKLRLSTVHIDVMCREEMKRKLPEGTFGYRSLWNCMERLSEEKKESTRGWLWRPMLLVNNQHITRDHRLYAVLKYAGVA